MPLPTLFRGASVHASGRLLPKLIHSKPTALRMVYYKRVFAERPACRGVCAGDPQRPGISRPGQRDPVRSKGSAYACVIKCMVSYLLYVKRNGYSHTEVLNTLLSVKFI